MAYVCYDFNSAPICDELENFNDCSFVKEGKQIRY